MTTDTLAKLAACPFCGDEDVQLQEIQSARDSGPVFVQCGACGAEGPPCDFNEDARFNWNRRALTAQAPAAAEPEPFDVRCDACDGRGCDECSSTGFLQVFLCRPHADAEQESVATKGTTAIVDAWNALPNELRLNPHMVRLFEAVKTCRDVDVPASSSLSFEDWWQRHGQFLRAGGGDYEKTFAYHAWLESPQAAQQAAQAPEGCTP